MDHIKPISAFPRTEQGLWEAWRLDNLRLTTPSANRRKGAALAVAERGDMRVVHLEGAAGEAGGVEAARVPLACVSKVLTAHAVLMLVQQGRLSLEDRVAGFLGAHGPKIVDRLEEVRLGSLLAHTSGLVARPSVVEAAEHVASPGGGEAAAFAGLARFAPPGEIYSYENLNYLLLGEVLRAVTDRSWVEDVEDLVLAPLGCGRLVRLEGGRGESEGAAPRTRRDAMVPAWCEPYGLDVEDVCRYGAAHLDPDALDPVQAAVVRMMRAAPGWGPRLGETDVRGFGVKHMVSGDYGHFGWTKASRVDLVISPRRGVCAALAVSGDVGQSLRLCAETLGGRLGLWAVGHSLMGSGRGGPPASGAGYAGVYRHEHMRAEITVEDGSLVFEFHNDSPVMREWGVMMPTGKRITLHKVAPRLFSVRPNTPYYVEFVGEEAVEAFRYVRMGETVFVGE